jgi:hypothetical protein
MSSITFFANAAPPVPTLDQVLTAGNTSSKDFFIQDRDNYVHVEKTGITSHGLDHDQFIQINPNFFVLSSNNGEVRVSLSGFVPIGPRPVRIQNLINKDGVLQPGLQPLISTSKTVTVAPGATSVVITGLTGTPTNATITPMSGNAEGNFFISSYGVGTITLKYAAGLTGGSTTYAIIYTY